jgi:hypothetical protein
VRLAFHLVTVVVADLMLVSPLVVIGHRNGLQNCRHCYVIAVITIQTETLEGKIKYLSSFNDVLLPKYNDIVNTGSSRNT